MIAFVVYSRETGAVLYQAADPLGAAGQTPNLPETQAAMDVPIEAFTENGLDFAPIRQVLVAKVDFQAEQTRMSFLTPGEGQALTYSYKADEAKRWTADHDVETPFLTAEAAARGMTVSDLAAEVLGAIGAWTVIGARIEAARMKAKLEIAAAETLPALADAAGVDWATVAGPPPAEPAADEPAPEAAAA